MLKVGFVDFINALPLAGKIIEDEPHDLEITQEVPSTLNQMLRQGDLDISMISTSEYLAHKDQYQLIDGFGIASEGPVHSVHLYAKLPLSYIKTIYVTSHTSSSYDLCRILCKLYWDVEPKFEVVEDLEELTTKDAFLLIGDIALMRPHFEGYHTITLTEHWLEMTRMPFVFCVIAARKDVDPALIASFKDKLQQSYEWGQNNPESIVEMARRSLPIQANLIANYYRSLYYALGEKDQEAIALFEELLAKINPQVAHV